MASRDRGTYRSLSHNKSPSTEHNLGDADYPHKPVSAYDRATLPKNENVEVHEVPGSGKESLRSVSVPQKSTYLTAWVLEAACLLLAIGCLIAIIKLLVDANGQPQQDWKAWIGFNTLIAILSTVFRSSISHVASEGINGPTVFSSTC